MRALSIRQPYAELILRGIKRIEFRSRPTKIIGERFWIYASKQPVVGKLLMEGMFGKPEIRNQKSESNLNDEIRMTNEPAPPTPDSRLLIPVLSSDPQPTTHDPRPLSSDNLEVPMDMPREWMIELAQMLIFKDLPTGVIVGSAVIDKVEAGSGATEGYYHWHLADVRREKRCRKPTGHPQPVWFTPFD